MWVTSGAGGPNASDGVWLVSRKGRARHVASGLHTALGLRWAAGRLCSARRDAVERARDRAARLRWPALPFAGNRSGRADDRPSHRRFDRPRASGPPLRRGRQHRRQQRPGRPCPVVQPERAPGATARSDGPAQPVMGSRSMAAGSTSPTTPATTWARRPPEELNAFNPSGPVPDFGFPGCFDQGGAPCVRKRRPVALPAGARVIRRARGHPACGIRGAERVLVRSQSDRQRRAADRSRNGTAQPLLARSGEARPPRGRHRPRRRSLCDAVRQRRGRALRPLTSGSGLAAGAVGIRVARGVAIDRRYREAHDPDPLLHRTIEPSLLHCIGTYDPPAAFHALIDELRPLDQYS